MFLDCGGAICPARVGHRAEREARRLGDPTGPGSFTSVVNGGTRRVRSLSLGGWGMSSTFDGETEAAGLWRTRSADMGITGHLSESVYRRCAIVD
jgi:hypothetical protein